MNEYKITFYLKNGTRKEFDNISIIEFCNDFVILQSYNGECFTVDTKDFDTFKVNVFYEILGR